MQPRPLFLRTSGSSGVPKALLLEGNGQLSCNPKKRQGDLRFQTYLLRPAVVCAEPYIEMTTRQPAF